VPGIRIYKMFIHVMSASYQILNYRPPKGNGQRLYNNNRPLDLIHIHIYSQ